MGLDRFLPTGLAVSHLELGRSVADAGETRADLPEEGGQPLEVALFPRLKGVVVALGAVDPHPEESEWSDRRAVRDRVARSRGCR